MRNIPLCIALLISLTSCSQRAMEVKAQANAIIGGESLAIQAEELKYTVAITKENDLAKSFCTGSLISKNHIITAAHCLIGSSFKNMQVAFVSNSTKFINIKEVHLAQDTLLRMHNLESVRGDFGHNFDIAILELEEEAPQNAEVIEILDPSESDKVLNRKIKLTGFGQDANGVVGRAKKVEVRAMDIRRNLLERSILLYEDDNGACRGDSGGPATVMIDDKTYLVGATQGYAKAAFDGVEDLDCSSGKGMYTFLPDYKAWIESVINKTEYNPSDFDYHPFEFAQNERENSSELECDNLSSLSIARWQGLYTYASRVIGNFKCDSMNAWFSKTVSYSEKPSSKAEFIQGKWRIVGNYYFLRFFSNLEEVTIDQSMRITRRDQMVLGVSSNVIYLNNYYHDFVIGDSVRKLSLSGGKLSSENYKALDDRADFLLKKVSVDE
ncbi:S1 family peptidase [Halobacteriovorax sp. XZX-3]|uniref:S1 family peptidase n=1 Tax=unclassified Halobacteriovorax TaxID=2639665 RepID=UPI003721F302